MPLHNQTKLVFIIEKIKKPLAFTVIFLFAGLVLGPPLKAENIRMAWFTLPPHVFIAEDGVTPTGPTIELFNTIAAGMGCTVDWIGPLPLSRLTKYQTQGRGRIDGSILCEKVPLLLPHLFYPKDAYFIGQPCLAVRAENSLKKIKSIDDIRGYRIGYVNMLGSDYPPFFQNNPDKVTIQNLFGNHWASRNLAKLISNRIDAVIELNRQTLEYEAAANHIPDRIRILNIPTEPLHHYYVFFKNSPKGKNLLERYENTVAEMQIDYTAMVEREIGKLRNR